MRGLLVIGLIVLATRAHAEPEQRAVALLPLDADANLELYGQPIAKEVARALEAGGLDVIVVGPKMAVPKEARLVVDGTLRFEKSKSPKNGTIVIRMRMRDANSGTIFDPPIVVLAQNQLAMDHAADELGQMVLAPVKAKLEALIEEDKKKAQQLEVKPPPVVQKPEVKLAPMLVAITGKPGELLVDALATAITPWAAHRHHNARVVDASRLGKLAPQAVASDKAELAVQLDVLSLATDHDPHQIPLTTARVHIRISDQQSIVFDRVIVTDTIVGEKDVATAKLIARVAREVLAIADPQVKRRIPSWY